MKNNNLLSKIKLKYEDITNPIQTHILYKNPLINTIYQACSSCYNNFNSAFTYEQKAEYIGKRVKAGHESILEHGYISFIIEKIPMSKYEDVIEVQNCPGSQYLIISTKIHNSDDKKHKYYNMLIGGSIRAFKHFMKFNMMDSDTGSFYINNCIIREVWRSLNRYTNKQLFINFLENQIYSSILEPISEPWPNSEYILKNGEYRARKTESLEEEDHFGNNKKVIVDFDNIHPIAYMAEQYGFDFQTVMRVIPITVAFKNISRTATHQLVRHRNAITQESQRYVDYSNASFTIPPVDYLDKFKESGNDYNKNINNVKFNIEFNDKDNELSLIELGDCLVSIYDQLIKQGLKKEDARAFLPSNVDCKTLYMTFTKSTLDSFINLRTAKGAQAEIKAYAKAIERCIY